MKIKYLLLLLLLFITACAASKDEVKKAGSDTLYTVKIINDSFEKVQLRYPTGDSSYTFRFVDPKNHIRFLMNGNLSIQYSLSEFSNAKIIKIAQDTLIHIKRDEVFIDSLPPEEKINQEPTGNIKDKSKQE